MRGCESNERAENELLDQALTALQGEEGAVLSAVSPALRKYASQKREYARKMGKLLNTMVTSDKLEVLSLKEEVKLMAECCR